MMADQIIIACVVLIAFSAANGNILQPCKKNDQVCVNKSAVAAWPLLLKGSSELGIEPSDPLKVPMVNADLANLKYTFTESTVTGLKDCAIGNVTLELDKSNLHVGLLCETLTMVGHYDIKGQILVLPIEGNGRFKIVTRGWQIAADMEVDEVADANGIKHLHIKSFKLDHDIKGNAKFELENLFNGQKELADSVLKFANDNWHEVAKEISSPGIYACCKKVVKSLNKYLKTLPMDTLFL